MPSQPQPATLPRHLRLRKRASFQRVFRYRLTASDRWMTLRAAPGEQSYTRLGIAVGRAFGNAVRRNRIKRLIREAFRHTRHTLPPGLDLVVLPRPDSQPQAHEIKQSLYGLAHRIAKRQTHTPGSQPD